MTKNTGTPAIFTIFGITGDLASKKIIPSLWHLFKHNHLPQKIAVVGFGRRDLKKEDYRKLILDSVRKHIDYKIGEKELNNFCDLFSYQMGTFEDNVSFENLKSLISKIEVKFGVCTNRLFYLSVPPTAYENIFQNLAKCKLNLPCDKKNNWTRILIEKPFGTDRESAKKLERLLSLYFKKEQIYRIDHYLFKEIIQGIENFRFDNNLFEKNWNNSTIESINIRLLESIGVEDRGNFYDNIGALKDVGQNHLLVMLALITMENPKNRDVQKHRAKIINSLQEWNKNKIKKQTFRAQYEGYEKIKGVKPNSTTETYFKLETELNDIRWKEVRIIMEAGKHMFESRKEIIVTFKNLKDKNGPKNKIIFRLEPNDEITISFITKKPGFEKEMEERVFSFFLYEKETKIQYVEEYAKIIYQSIKGDQTLFVSEEEILASWKFIDPIVKEWQNNSLPLLKYKWKL